MEVAEAVDAMTIWVPTIARKDCRVTIKSCLLDLHLLGLVGFQNIQQSPRIIN